MILSLLLLGCKTGPVAISDITAETSTQVVTAINVSWTTNVESSGYVEYGLTGASDVSWSEHEPYRVPHLDVKLGSLIHY